MVISDLTVSPSSLMLGILQPGQKVTKQIVLKGKQPFRVTAIECDAPGFSFPSISEAKTVHLIPVTFVAGKDPVKLTEKIIIRTDLEEHKLVELPAFGQVLAPLAGN